MLAFIYILSAIAFVLFGLVMRALYRRFYLRSMVYVIHKDVEKEVELPPLDNNMEFQEEQIQHDDKYLHNITI